ncbi:MAG: tyrosine-type recombinase/integrase [Bacteroidetes bacterium]|nr:tyrosine-type recombinase/integrase [Bacteroidota bacterium]
MLPKEWKTDIITYHREKRIAIKFEKRAAWIQEIKKIPGARWSPALRAWHIADCEAHRKLCGIALEDRLVETIQPETAVNQELVNQLEHLSSWMRSRRYSAQTISSYMGTLSVFFSFYKGRSVESIVNEDVLYFNSEYILKRKLSASYQSQFINALKLFYGILADKKLVVDKLVRPQKPFSLPKVLDISEVAAIINATENLKHKSMLSLIYSGGLRRGELLNLVLTDIDSKRMMIMIRGGKGMKDRQVPLSVNILEMLRNYYLRYRPKTHTCFATVMLRIY